MNRNYNIENLDPEEQASYRRAMASIKEAKENKPTALGQVGNAIMNGADLAISKLDDLAGLATGLVLLPYEYLSGDKGEVTRYLNEQDEKSGIKKQLSKNIRERRERLDEYVEQNLVKGTVLKVATGFIEQGVDPFQAIPNYVTNGFLANALLNTTDYLYEEKLISDRNITDFDLSDGANIGIGVALAGLTSKFEAEDVAKPLYQEFTPSLDKIIKTNQDNEGNVLLRKEIADVVKRQESGQTLSFPKGFNNSENVAKTIDDGVIPRLRTIASAITNKDLNSQYEMHYAKTIPTKDGKVKIKGAVVRAVKPIYTEVELGRAQALGEIADDLIGWLIKGEKYDGITPTGDIISEVTSRVNTEDFIRLVQGKSENPELKDLQNILHRYVNEFVSIKSGTDVSYKEKGFYLDTLYNKQHIMTELYNITGSTKNKILFDEDGAKAFIKGQLKDVGEKVFINGDEAIRYGLGKAGYYDIEENPIILKKFLYDINGTTKDVAKANRKGTLDFEKKTLFDVAFDWVNMTDKEKYIELINKKTRTEAEDIYVKNFQEEMMSKFEGVFKGYEQKPEEAMQNMIATIANERSGYNLLMDKFENFVTAYKANEQSTNDIALLDFSMPHKQAKILKKEIDNFKGLNAYNLVKEKLFEELEPDEKLMKGIKDFSAWKLLFGLRHLREATPNTSLINSGMYKLGFDTRYSYIKGNYDMAKVHYDLAKNVDAILKRDLSSISNPIERLEAEIFIKKISGNKNKFKNFVNKITVGTLEKAATIAGSGQTISDVHRTAGAIRFTSKAMYDEFPKLEYDKMTGEMRNILKSNGIDESNLIKIQSEIKGFKSYENFLEFALNSNAEQGGKIKSLFEQFVDVAGREFEAYDKNFTKIEGSHPLTRIWLGTNLLFKRYSMGAFSRAYDNVSSYYDANDILRSRFSSPTTLFKNWSWKGTKFHTSNLAKMSLFLGISTEAIRWVHGKAFGTPADEMVEAKYEALMNGDYVPIIADTMIDSLTDYVGYDVMFGGTPAIIGIIDDAYSALQRDATADNLKSYEKILYGIAHVLSPQNVSRGIDYLKFGRNITSKLNTWSEEAQFNWKTNYRDEALIEQSDGELPIMKFMSNITNWKEWFDKNEDKAYEVTNFPEDTDKEVTKITATGIMEMTEESLRQDHINYSFSLDTVEEREKSLEQFGLDYKTQLNKLDPKIRDLFNYVMAYKDIKDPHYLTVALEEIVNSKDKIKTLNDFLDESDIPYFDNFARNIMEHEEKKKEIARRGYDDNLEGYIEFLQTLRNEM